MKVLSDGWTAVTRDRSLSAQFEHTVGVTERRRARCSRSRRPGAQAALRSNLRTRADCKRRSSRHAAGMAPKRDPAEHPSPRRAALSRPPRAAARALPRGRRASARRLRDARAGAVPRAAAARREAAGQGAARQVRLVRRGDRRRRPSVCKEVEGLGEAAVIDLKIVQAAASGCARGALAKRPVLSSWSAVIDYCRAAHGLRREGAVPHPVPRQEEPADRRRGAAGGHRRPHAGLSARGGASARWNCRRPRSSWCTTIRRAIRRPRKPTSR